jgi:CHRD domain-containing protein
MRENVLAFGILTAVVAWPIAAHAADELYHASLSGADEVPPIATGGLGSVSIDFDPATKKLTWKVDYSGLSGPVAGAHIHCGALPGANAEVSVPLGAAPNLASPIQGSGTMTDAQVADLHGGKCYVNVHTDTNKGGELRGQLVPWERR